VAPGKCSSCGDSTRVEWVTVRVYVRRAQLDYRYHLCVECKTILRTFLEGSAVSIQRGLFNHQTGEVISRFTVPASKYQSMRVWTKDLDKP
jgi:hypothetical protein